MDLTKLSDADLEALQSGDLSKVSDEGLTQLQSSSGAPAETATGAVAPTKEPDLGTQAVGALQTGAHFAGQALSNPLVQHGLEIGGGGLALNKILKNAVNQYAQSVNPASSGMANQVAQTVGNQTSVTGTGTGPTATVPANTNVNTGPKLELQQGGKSPGGMSNLAPNAQISPAVAQSESTLSRLGQLGSKYAGIANKLITPAVIGKELFYTSPEEHEILKRAEAEKQAQGWKPANPLEGRWLGGYINSQAENQARQFQNNFAKLPVNMQTNYYNLPENKKVQVRAMIINGQDPASILGQNNAITSGFSQQLNNLAK